jgi:amidohydrolase
VTGAPFVAAREACVTTVEGVAEKLIGLSHAVHADRETAFEEVNSARRVADALAKFGYAVETGICDLPTAFRATVGEGPLNLGICAEYDALPGVGHACGHNVIAAAAVGAAAALAPLADELGLTITVLGTPAEEGGGGKVLMLERGGFDRLHAAMMVHPGPTDESTISCLAVRHVRVAYSGRSAHAAGRPEMGVNAADALTVAQVSIGLLRQHLRGSDRVHGIVTHGGDAPNVVPERATGDWYVRARTLAEVDELFPKIVRCFEAGAVATGASMAVEETGPALSEFVHDPDLLSLWIREASINDRVFRPPSEGEPFVGSTDMANVSLAMPAIHPMLGIDAGGASNHQPAFATACITASADRAVLDGAMGMAKTIVAIAESAPLRERLVSGSLPIGV